MCRSASPAVKCSGSWDLTGRASPILICNIYYRAATRRPYQSLSLAIADTARARCHHVGGSTASAAFSQRDRWLPATSPSAATPTMSGTVARLQWRHRHMRAVKRPHLGEQLGPRPTGRRCSRPRLYAEHVVPHRRRGRVRAVAGRCRPRGQLLTPSVTQGAAESPGTPKEAPGVPGGLLPPGPLRPCRSLFGNLILVISVTCLAITGWWRYRISHQAVHQRSTGSERQASVTSSRSRDEAHEPLGR